MSELIIIRFDNDDCLLKAMSSLSISDIASSDGISQKPVKEMRISAASQRYKANRDEILEMVRRGEFQRVIAEKFGFSTTFLQNRLKKEGFKKI